MITEKFTNQQRESESRARMRQRKLEIFSSIVAVGYSEGEAGGGVAEITGKNSTELIKWMEDALPPCKV